MIVLCPTKGRPNAVAETYASFIRTRTLPTTQLLFVVNHSDLDPVYAGVPHLRTSGDHEWMNEVLDKGVQWALEQDPDIIGFIGDDNRFETRGWDEIITKKLEKGGFAYGDDLLQRQNLPSHVFVTTKIVRELGWFGLPSARHLYLDNTWKVLGQGAGCLYYVPQVVVRHLHPAVGAAKWDDSYVASNSQDNYAHDGQVFKAWLESQSDLDIQRVRFALG